MKGGKRLKAIRAVLLLVLAVCLVYLGRGYFLSRGHRAQQAELKALAAGETVGETEEDVLDKYRSLYEENSDFAGWISIEGTKIDYPVMRNSVENYYLNHDFYGNESRYGCLFVKNAADIDTPGTNFIVYGHNMKDGSMLGELDGYTGREFYEVHRQIVFETLTERRVYEVLAAFSTELSEAGNSFRYYEFYQADTEEEFLDFYDHIKKLSMYDTGVTAEFGDTFLTLSTCDNRTENGRFVVVAKRVE